MKRIGNGGAAIFADDFKEAPYWWDALPVAAGRPAEPSLPGSADVVVVGGGLTGVTAACELARAGRSVIVLDAGEPGRGASSRNHGMLGRNFKHPFTTLIETAGLDGAVGYYRELHEAYRSALARIEDEGLACDLRKNGRFIGALSPRHYERLAREYNLRAKHLGEAVEIVPASKQTEIGSERYHGGVVIHDNAALQPALYYEAMRCRAERSGAMVIGNTAATGIERQGDRFEVRTARGGIAARDVLLATNGYTPKSFSWPFRRLIPINAYTVMTEPLPADIAKTLLPGHRTYHDNRRRSNPFALAPDGSNRLLFGSRTGRLPPGSLPSLAAKIHEDMLAFFPQLAGVKLTHAWLGRCAATWDLFPHTGLHDGVHYALGYCFSGNAMAPYLGVKSALRIMGSAEARTRFESLRFPEAPWPARSRWFMPSLMTYYAWADRPIAPRTGVRVDRPGSSDLPREKLTNADL
jgi:glycine/D-amino acid oxidase-like deaminating enzyme